MSAEVPAFQPDLQLLFERLVSLDLDPRLIITRSEDPVYRARNHDLPGVARRPERDRCNP